MKTPTLFDNIENTVRHSTDSAITDRFDRHEREIVRFLEEEYGDLTHDEKLAVMLVSLFILDGHVCMPVDKTVAELEEMIDLDRVDLEGHKLGKLKLENSKLIGEPGSGTPLILDGNFLYIHRYFNQEKTLKKWIDEKNSGVSVFDVSSEFKKSLDELFKDNKGEINWQKVAAVMSVFKSFLIISGGPGTGKTTTVARLLALHQRTANKPLRIALAAPTGKAAGRMGEALFAELQKLNITEEQLKWFPSEAQTIHRLLREVENHGLLPPVRLKTLPYDIIVVDEASMIDLSLIYRLIRHLSDHTKLVLLGDKDQLASVEAGSVFADLCRKKENFFSLDTINKLKMAGIDVSENGKLVSGTDDSIVYLTKSYRFDEKSGIGQLAEKVKHGISNEKSLMNLFQEFPDITHREFDYSKDDFDKLNTGLQQRVKEAGMIRDPEELLNFWKQSVWLTVLRRGFSGSERLNRLTEQILATTRSVRMQHGWYHGRPVMITRNNYDLGVFNGDHGVCAGDTEGIFRVYIQSGSEIKKIKPERLLHFSPAYFLTVHKSQGSEFNKVNLLLPGKKTPILTRELLYTAITRARIQFHLFGDIHQFMDASNRITKRYSGLGR